MEKLGRVLNGLEGFLCFSNDQQFLSMFSFDALFSVKWYRGTLNVHLMLQNTDLSWLSSKCTFSFRAYVFRLLLENGF